ncbi:MAG: universal stress protein [Bacteriovoracaceae bacterium]
MGGIPSPQVEIVLSANGLEKNIIYPVGNSELNEKAVKVLADLCTNLKAKAVLIYVEDKWHTSDAVATDSSEWKQIRENWLREGQALLDREAEKLKQLNVAHIEKEMRFGEFSDEINKVVSERRSEMIVLASQHASPIGTLLMGQRTYNLFRHVSCPILRIVR